MSLQTGTENGLQAQYFSGVDLNPASVVLSRIDPTVDFRWGNSAPDSSISNTNFSARWTGQVQAKSSGVYTFATSSDDGIRLWVDGKQLINNWSDHPEAHDQGDINLVAGQKYDIKLEYYQRTGKATVQLFWNSPGMAREIIPQSQLYANSIPSPVPTPILGNGDGLAAQYFNDKTLGNLALSRVDSTVNFDWQNGSPAAGMNSDNFSARWTGQVQAKYSEAYTFTTNSDDGVRLWVDGKQLINNWTDHALTEDKGTINLIAGQKYDIKLEYYENAGRAALQLMWSSAHQAQEIVPQSQLFSAGIPSSIPIPTPIVTFDLAFHDSDPGVPNDAHPDGVPQDYSWYHSAAQPGWMNGPRTDWHAATAWGQVYAVEGWHPEQAPNTRVQLRDDQLWILSKSSGKWTEVQPPGIQGGAFRSDFGNNGSTGVTTKDETNNGGGLSVTAGNGFNYHFWPGARATIDPTDIAGVYSVFQARLVTDDVTKPDDRAQARYIASGGADYWRSTTAAWASDWSNNGGINGGRFKTVDSDWKTYSMQTLTADQMAANPPPVKERIT